MKRVKGEKIMSVLIKGMKIPKNCDECVLLDSNYFCTLIGEVDESINNGSKDLRCPLVEVPTITACGDCYDCPYHDCHLLGDKK